MQCHFVFNEPILHFVMGTGLLCGSYLIYCSIGNQLQRRTAEIHLFNKAFFFPCYQGFVPKSHKKILTHHAFEPIQSNLPVIDLLPSLLVIDRQKTIWSHCLRIRNHPPSTRLQMQGKKSMARAGFDPKISNSWLHIFLLERVIFTTQMFVLIPPKTEIANTPVTR